jgi:uncharacterized membrane protein (DUF4010 family)
MMNLLPAPVFALIIASLLGAVLGIRREMDAQEEHNKASFMGVRTTIILTVLGTLSTFFPTIPQLPIIIFIGVLTLTAIAYAHGSFSLNKIGMTSEFAGFITFWIGVLVGLGNFTIAILLTIFLAILKEFRDDLHKFVHTLTVEENRGMVQLLALSGAILPFLPREAIDPWGVFVPFNVWLLVILISGLAFIGYFLTKYFGFKGGVPMTAFLGSLVSSTAVTAALAEKSKTIKKTGILAVGIILAMGVMQMRVLLEVFFLGTDEFRGIFLLVPLAMGVTSLILAYLAFWKFSQNKKEISSVDHEVKVSSPFEILPALKFGLIFVAVLFAITFGKKYLGDLGVYGAALLSGLIDIDAVVLSSMEAVKQGELPVNTAKTAVFLGLLMNSLIKIVYVSILGSKNLTKKIFAGIITVSLIGILAFVFV